MQLHILLILALVAPSHDCLPSVLQHLALFLAFFCSGIGPTKVAQGRACFACAQPRGGFCEKEAASTFHALLLNACLIGPFHFFHVADIGCMTWALYFAFPDLFILHFSISLAFYALGGLLHLPACVIVCCSCMHAFSGRKPVVEVTSLLWLWRSQNGMWSLTRLLP